MLFYVHRAPLPLCFQFSRRRFPARELSRGLRQSEHAGDGAARSRWCLWLSAFPHGSEESADQSAHWSGGNMRIPITTETSFDFAQDRLRHGENQESQSQRFLCASVSLW